MPKGNFSIFISLQGCPYQCIYCDQRKISGEAVMTPEKAAFQLQNGMPLWEKRGMQGQIAFFGGTFTGLPTEEMEAYLQAAYPYVLSGAAEGIRISTRPDCIDRERLAVLKQYGVTHIELGVQSMDDDVLKRSGRGYTSSKVEESAALIREYGFVLGMQMMPGLPGDDDAKCEMTADKIISCGAAETRIYPTLVLRDTPLEELYREGRYLPMDLKHAVRLTAVLKEKFENRGVTVLKVGLHSGTVEQDVVAGPFHPAFGQLVSGKICLHRLESHCLNNSLKNTVLTVVPKNFDPSDIVGHHKCNAVYLKENYNVSIKISKKLLTNTFNSIIL